MKPPEIVAASLMVIVVALCCGGYNFWSEETQTCTVTSSDRTNKDMRVYTDCGVFTVGDVWLRGEFSSADTYGSIEDGATYEFTTIGWRIPVLSVFPKVIEATQVKE